MIESGLVLAGAVGGPGAGGARCEFGERRAGAQRFLGACWEGCLNGAGPAGWHRESGSRLPQSKVTAAVTVGGLVGRGPTGTSAGPGRKGWLFEGPFGEEPDGDGVVILVDDAAAALEGLFHEADFEAGGV